MSVHWVCQKASNLPCFSLNSSRHLPTEYLTSCIITMPLNIPFSFHFLEQLQENERIRIDAVFKEDDEMFKVMLLCDGNKDMADAPLIIEMDGSSDILIYYRKRGIKRQTITVPRCDYLKDKELHLCIEMKSSYFKITLNELDLVKFRYQFPLKMVKYIWIDGDINLKRFHSPDHHPIDP